MTPNPNVPICLACPRRQRDCGGPCACTVSGRDIRAHYEAGDCPLGRFVARGQGEERSRGERAEPAGGEPVEPARGLGDSVARVLDATGVGPLAKKVIEAATGKPCGCAARRAALNRLVPWRK